MLCKTTVAVTIFEKKTIIIFFSFLLSFCNFLKTVPVKISLLDRSKAAGRINNRELITQAPHNSETFQSVQPHDLIREKQWFLLIYRTLINDTWHRGKP